MTVPQAALSVLHRADGSADHTHSGYRVICAVNGPVEVQRRDEIPDEAAIEVNFRPSVGIGGPKERHLESLIHSTLRHTILTHIHPRSLIQITLQVLSVPEGYDDLRSSSHIPILPALLNTAILALLSASIPLLTTPTSVLLTLSPSGAATPNPTPAQLRKSKSTHAFCFSSAGDVLLAESEGSFSVDEWEVAEAEGRRVCLEEDTAGVGAGKGDGDRDVDMEDDDDEGGVALGGSVAVQGAQRERKGLMGVVEGVVGEKVGRDQAWRGA